LEGDHYNSEAMPVFVLFAQVGRDEKPRQFGSTKKTLFCLGKPHSSTTSQNRSKQTII
ncbi:9691_t:CDS:2, partial [Cetraspora pellucida]